MILRGYFDLGRLGAYFSLVFTTTLAPNRFKSLGRYADNIIGTQSAEPAFFRAFLSPSAVRPINGRTASHSKTLKIISADPNLSIWTGAGPARSMRAGTRATQDPSWGDLGPVPFKWVRKINNISHGRSRPGYLWGALPGGFGPQMKDA